MQGQEAFERIVVLLPEAVVKELDKLANEQGLSRSGLIRTVLMRDLRERGEKA